MRERENGGEREMRMERLWVGGGGKGRKVRERREEKRERDQ